MIRHELVSVRPFVRTQDLAAIQGLETSFSSDWVYEVIADSDSIALKLQRAPQSHQNRFQIDPNRPVWTRGWVAEVDGRVCGFVATCFDAWNRRLTIWHFYVDSPYRRCGIGRRLMNCALEDGWAQGARTAWVETSSRNHPAVLAYKRLGFKLCGFDTTLYNATPNKASSPCTLLAPSTRRRQARNPGGSMRRAMSRCLAFIPMHDGLGNANGRRSS